MGRSPRTNTWAMPGSVESSEKPTHTSARASREDTTLTRTRLHRRIPTTASRGTPTEAESCPGLPGAGTPTGLPSTDSCPSGVTRTPGTQWWSWSHNYHTLRGCSATHFHKVGVYSMKVTVMKAKTLSGRKLGTHDSNLERGDSLYPPDGFSRSCVKDCNTAGSPQAEGHATRGGRWEASRRQPQC